VLGKTLVVGLEVKVVELLDGEGAEAEKEGNLTSGDVVAGAAGLVAKGFCAVSNALCSSGLGENKEKGPGARVTPVPTVVLVTGANEDEPRAKGLGAAGAAGAGVNGEAKGLREAGEDNAGA